MNQKNNIILYSVISVILVASIVVGLSVFTLNSKVSDLDKVVQNSSSSSFNSVNDINFQNQSDVPNSMVGNLTQEEKDSLVYMREEEKLARDVYQTLGQTYDLKIFDNIANSEQKHMDSIEVLLDKYNLVDPVLNNGIGEFSNPDLANLYSQLVEKGKKSQVEALKVGATIEDLDIKDLTEDMTKTSNPDIIEVYTRLRSGSYNHLRAFTNNLKKTGDSYTPQYISQAEYDQILATSTNQGGQGRGGRGQGNDKN